MSHRDTITKDHFKQTISQYDSRRKRETLILNQRRQRRHENLSKKRNFGDTSSPIILERFTHSSYEDTLFDDLDQSIRSNDIEKVTIATEQIRRLLSSANNPPISEVVQRGWVPLLISFLGSNVEQLQFEATWALTNVTSSTSEDTSTVVDNGGVKYFIQLLQHHNDNIKEQAVWALGNIAGDCIEYRDLVLKSNAMPYLLQCFSSSRVPLLRNAMWTLSNLCRGNPPPPRDVVEPCLEIVSQLLKLDDIEIVKDACWTLSYLSGGNDENIQSVLNAGVARRLIQLLSHERSRIVVPALRTVGNIISGQHSQTQVMIDNNVIICLLRLLYHTKYSIRKEAAWSISNIAAGTPDQIQRLIDADVYNSLSAIILQQNVYEVRKECAWAIVNSIIGGTEEQSVKIAQSQAIEALCSILEMEEAKICITILQSLDKLMIIGASIAEQNRIENPFLKLLEKCSGDVIIKNLQNHDHPNVHIEANRFVDHWLEEEEEIEGIDFEIDTTPSHFNFKFE